MPLQPSDTVGAYQIEKQLGTGGMATVYKAHHTKLDRYVAIKVMHPQLLEDENFHARFEREARIVAKLEHPNIVPVYDYSEIDHQPYLVMKYIEGQTLKQIIKQRAVSLDEILLIMERVAIAIDYAHQQGVLHRDLKPSNIILDDKGTPYVADFGLARIAQMGESTMSADTMLGTPQYISPEQARGDKSIDQQTDLYSLGIILYELLVGRVPFSADTAFATIHDQIYTQPPQPSSLNAEITPEVEAVLLKGIAKDPQARYTNAKAMIRALQEALRRSGLEELDPARAQNAVPTSFSATPTSKSIPNIPNPMRETMQQSGVNFNPERMMPRVGGRWVQDGPEGPGFYTEEELVAADSGLTEEQRIRRFVKKRMEERMGLWIHGAAYFGVNLLLWMIWLGGSIGDGEINFMWPLFVTFGWGIGMFAHFFEYYNKYGGGRDRQEQMVQEEITRERERRSQLKLKNEELEYDPANRIRLNDDGEMTESFIDELDPKRKRQ